MAHKNYIPKRIKTEHATWLALYILIAFFLLFIVACGQDSSTLDSQLSEASSEKIAAVVTVSSEVSGEEGRKGLESPLSAPSSALPPLTGESFRLSEELQSFDGEGMAIFLDELEYDFDARYLIQLFPPDHARSEAPGDSSLQFYLYWRINAEPEEIQTMLEHREMTLWRLEVLPNEPMIDPEWIHDAAFQTVGQGVVWKADRSGIYYLDQGT